MCFTSMVLSRSPNISNQTVKQDSRESRLDDSTRLKRCFEERICDRSLQKKYHTLWIPSLDIQQDVFFSKLSMWEKMTQVTYLGYLDHKSGFAIITWNNRKKLEKPEKSPWDKRYDCHVLGLIFPCNKVLMVDHKHIFEQNLATSSLLWLEVEGGFDRGLDKAFMRGVLLALALTYNPFTQNISQKGNLYPIKLKGWT